MAGVHRIGLIRQEILLPHPQIYVGVGWDTAGPHGYATNLEIMGAHKSEKIMKQKEFKHL